ncbi:hypothetical protein Glove_221g80 [Diversispora epigaea]|uniref:Uncharacterized protein n=1 Tax=Diversispora epigaea TaxID=1348612 RepID=A0A397IK68_9GLOM|nr:hypothetical protein Glove_221g80 [Diversispora epigaea]
MISQPISIDKIMEIENFNGQAILDQINNFMEKENSLVYSLKTYFLRDLRFRDFSVDDIKRFCKGQTRTLPVSREWGPNETRAADFLKTINGINGLSDIYKNSINKIILNRHSLLYIDVRNNTFKNDRRYRMVDIAGYIGETPNQDITYCVRSMPPTSFRILHLFVHILIGLSVAIGITCLPKLKVKLKQPLRTRLNTVSIATEGNNANIMSFNLSQERFTELVQTFFCPTKYAVLSVYFKYEESLRYLKHRWDIDKFKRSFSFTFREYISSEGNEDALMSAFKYFEKAWNPMIDNILIPLQTEGPLQYYIQSLTLEQSREDNLIFYYGWEDDYDGILQFCERNLGLGRGQDIIYDLQKIEQELARSLIFEKVHIEMPGNSTLHYT